MPIFGPNQYFLRPGGQFVPPRCLFLRVRWTQKKMFCMPWKPFNKCFRGATTKKKHFSPENGQKMPIVSQIRVFWVQLVSWSPSYHISRVLDSEKDVLRAIEAIAHVFQGRHYQKNTIFHPKMAKKCQFSAQISIFWVRVVSLCPPLPILRVLE